MTIAELIEQFERNHRRCHLLGTEDAGVVIGLDLEGRLFTGLAGTIVNRVNPEAFSGISTQEAYLNPGGDGLWPAPEGSILGYEYPTGTWRVPPGLTAARYRVTNQNRTSAKVRAEIDLVNGRGIGLPTAFERHVGIRMEANTIEVTVTESIEYLGNRTLDRSEALLAPWSLCQFDSGPGCQVSFPDAGGGAVWDLYDPSDTQRVLRDDLWLTRTEGGPRYQIGLSPKIDWLEFTNPRKRLTVRRTASRPPADQAFIDIADRPPDAQPDGAPVRFSVYSDPDCFMEIEAAGGCPEILNTGERMEFTVITAYSIG